MMRYNPYRVYHGEEPKIEGKNENDLTPLSEMPVAHTRQEAANHICSLPDHLKHLHIIYMEEEVGN